MRAQAAGTRSKREQSRRKDESVGREEREKRWKERSSFGRFFCKYNSGALMSIKLLLKNKNLNILASVGILTPKNKKSSMPITIPPTPAFACMTSGLPLLLAVSISNSSKFKIQYHILIYILNMNNQDTYWFELFQSWDLEKTNKQKLSI